MSVSSLTILLADLTLVSGKCHDSPADHRCQSSAFREDFKMPTHDQMDQTERGWVGEFS